MTNKIKLTGAALFLTLIPAVSSAATYLDKTQGILKAIGDLVKIAIPIAAALALLFFFWGLAKFILNADSEDGQEKGKNIMKWGIVALFVIVAIWGIISWIKGELGLNTGNEDQKIPTFQNITQ